MRFFEHTLASIAANLACDEALLDQAESDATSEEVLRVWQAEQPFVVLGRSSRVDQEVQIELARRESIPVFRRVSGGASIVADAGCLFYGLVLSLETRPYLRMLDEAHRFVMTQLLFALQPFAPDLQLDGTCDLVLAGKKVSGNSVRMVRNWMLYHGTILLHSDLETMDRLLMHPPREPAYRQGRSHRDFVANLGAPREQVIESIKVTWNARQSEPNIPCSAIEKLVREKYTQDAWNLAR